MTLEILDPTHEDRFGGFALAPRLASVDGITLGIISNGKKNTKPFFDAFERVLRDRYGVGEVIRLTKGNYSAPAEPEIIQQAERWQALVSGIGDWGSCSSCSLHDAIIGDRLGIPSAGIMTEKFTSAADLMARVLGAEGYRYAVVDHPISSASPDALEIRAATAAEACVGILTAW